MGVSEIGACSRKDYEFCGLRIVLAMRKIIVAATYHAARCRAEDLGLRPSQWTYATPDNLRGVNCSEQDIHRVEGWEARPDAAELERALAFATRLPSSPVG